MDTQDYVRDADIFYFNRDKQQEAMANAYAENVTANMHNLDTFKSFLWDMDVDAPEVQAFHGCLDDDQNTKAFAYDQLMNLYEEYVHSITEL